MRGKSIYLIIGTPLLPSPMRLAAYQPESLFLGLLTSHHVPLGHIKGRGVAICIGSVFKQDGVVILRLRIHIGPVNVLLGQGSLSFPEP